MVGPSYPFKGGIAQFTTRLFRELAARHEVVFLSFKRQYPSWLYPGETDKDFSDTDLRDERVIPTIDPLSPLSWYRTAKTLAQSSPDLVIFPWWIMFWGPPFVCMILILRIKLKDTRILFLCHNVVAHEPSWLSKVLTRLTLRRGDAFLVQSDEDEASLCEMLNNPDVARFDHPSYDLSDELLIDQQQAQTRLGLEGDVILFFGFIRPYKGLRYLLEAMPRVLRTQKCTLLVAGESWGEKEEYLQLIDELGIKGHVLWKEGYIPQEQVSEIFSASDLVVLPYTSATGSGVVKLAYSYHRPVIVSDVGSLPAAVDVGSTGYVVNAEDSTSLADAILTFFQGENQLEMSANIARRVRDFSWDELTQKVELLASGNYTSH